MNGRVQPSLLYWPGMRREPGELDVMLCRLRQCGWTIRTLAASYDIGPPPSSGQSTLYSDTNALLGCAWWIGLSLGASVACAALPHVPTLARPRRLTMINPFINRQDLAEERGFDVTGQWQIEIDVNTLPQDLQLDIVISEDDDRIPPNHGLSIHALATEVLINEPALIRVQGNHRLDGTDLQQLVAARLLGLESQ